jgi:site-specific DNA recombinase
MMAKTSTIEEKMLKDILTSKYKDYYLIYNRKSTDEKNNQKNSISYQKAENSRFSDRQNFPIAPISIKGFCTEGIISEKHSAFKEDNEITFTDDGQVQYHIERPKFQRLSYFLSKGLFKGVIFLCWDRASRNKGDETIIRKLMNNGIDFRFVYATYDDSSSGALHMDVDGMFSAHHSRVTSEKVTLTKRNLRAQGVCTYKAPIGYLNLGDMWDKPFDPERAPIILKLFEMYTTSDWSLADLARWANEQGLTTVPVRRRRTEEEMLADDEDEEIEIEPVSRPITANYLHKILTNRFYTGRIQDNDGSWIMSVSHKALVSDELFERVQQELRKKKVSKYHEERIEYPYRGKVRCADCGRVYTPYVKKGIVYYGARCADGCNNEKKSFNADFIEKKVGEMISHLSFTDEELVELDARTKTDVALLENKRLKEIDALDRKKRKIREDLTYIRTNKLTLLKTGAYSPEAFLEEENNLNAQLIAIQNEEQASDISMHATIKDILKLSELLKNAYLYFSLATSTEKEQIMSVIFSELSLSGNTLKYKCKNGFAALESRFTSSHDPTGSRTPLSTLRRSRPNR